MAREHLLVGAGNLYYEQNTLLENTDFTKNVVNKILNVVKQEWVRWIRNFWSNQQEWKEKTLIALKKVGHKKNVS